MAELFLGILDVSLQGKAAKYGFHEIWYDGRGDDLAASHHSEKLEHAVVHEAGLESEGHHRGEERLSVGLCRAWLGHGRVEAGDCGQSVRDGLSRVLGAARTAVKMGRRKCEHRVDEELVLHTDVSTWLS